jgi:O-antigen ligase
MTIRIWFFREGWKRMLEHLPWGMGLWQGFRNSDKLQGLDPHNFPLLIGGDLGIPGLVLWGWLNFVIARAWWRTRVDGPSRNQANAMLLTLVLANLNSCVEPTFTGAQFNLMFFWILAGTLSYAVLDRERTGRNALPTPPRRDTPETSGA